MEWIIGHVPQVHVDVEAPVSVPPHYLEQFSWPVATQHVIMHMAPLTGVL